MLPGASSLRFRCNGLVSCSAIYQTGRSAFLGLRCGNGEVNIYGVRHIVETYVVNEMDSALLFCFEHFNFRQIGELLDLCASKDYLRRSKCACNAQVATISAPYCSSKCLRTFFAVKRCPVCSQIPIVLVFFHVSEKCEKSGVVHIFSLFLIPHFLTRCAFAELRSRFVHHEEVYVDHVSIRLVLLALFTQTP